MRKADYIDPSIYTPEALQALENELVQMMNRLLGLTNSKVISEENKEMLHSLYQEWHQENIDFNNQFFNRMADILNSSVGYHVPESLFIALCSKMVGMMMVHMVASQLSRKELNPADLAISIVAMGGIRERAIRNTRATIKGMIDNDDELIEATNLYLKRMGNPELSL